MYWEGPALPRPPECTRVDGYLRPASRARVRTRRLARIGLWISNPAIEGSNPSGSVPREENRVNAAAGRRRPRPPAPQCPSGQPVTSAHDLLAPSPPSGPGNDLDAKREDAHDGRRVLDCLHLGLRVP